MLPTLGSMLRNVTQRHPSRVALEFEHESYTYAQLHSQSNRVANTLAGLNLAPGDRIATLLPSCPEFLLIYFAAAKGGMLFAPLNLRLSERELATTLAILEPQVLFTEPRWYEFAREQQRLLPSLRHVILVDGVHQREKTFHDLIQQGVDSDVTTPVDPESPHMVLFTSGTTGTPKGALLSQRQVVYNAMAIGLELGTRAYESVLTNAPLYHIAGLHNHTVPSLLFGGRVILHRQFDPELVLRELHSRTISNLFMVPTMWAQLLEAISASSEPVRLQRAFSGGAPLPIALLDGIREHITSNFYNSYGLTEAGPFVALLEPELLIAKRGSCGRAVFNMAIRTVDREGRQLSASAEGEIEVCGAHAFTGYLNNADATSATFNGSWIRTGDVGRLDDEGFLWILDRKKDMVVSGGENVYSSEVEQVLSTHPQIKECAIIGLPDSKWGEAVTAVVVPREGAEPILDQIRDYCSSDLARYKLPKRLVILSSLPRTASGKVLKRQLRLELTESGAGV